MADETQLMKQLNIVDKNNVTHEFEVKDAQARADISAAKELNFNADQFNVTETNNTVNVSLSANAQYQNNYLKGDGSWVDLEGTFGNTIDTMSGIIDNEFAETSAYIDEVSGAAETQFGIVTDEIANLYETKQDNLSAGDGIAITNDVVSHSIKIIENNDQEDTIEDTIMTVYLKNNHYKVITLDPTVTEIHFWITKTESNVLQETGFEFQVPEDSELNDLEFRIIDDNKKIYTILPRFYKTPNIYQGTIVNYRCTVGEYEVED